MELFYRKYGEAKPPLIIVHGLYGASDNWVTIAKSLSEHFEVFLLDQRNHGRSPHSPDHNYDSMKDDLLEFMDRMEIEKAVLVGHSMGGKTVMFFARDYPERITSLVVVDIAPKSYNTPDEASLKTINHKQIIGAMNRVDFSKVSSRLQVEEELGQSIYNDKVRQFLMKNLHRNKDNTFHWSLNVDALERNMPHILEGMCQKDFEKGNGIVGFPVLFVRGAKSQYILDEDIDNIILTIFPFAEVVTIPNAGHWVHAEQPKLLVKNLLYFVLE